VGYGVAEALLEEEYVGYGVAEVLPEEE